MRLGERSRWLIWLSLSEIGTMFVFSNYSALLPVLQKEWSLTNSQAGWIYAAYQIGYIFSVIFLSSLTDYRSPKYIYVLSAFWTGLSGILFSIGAEGFYSALMLRTLMGVGFAGTYMPGLRMVSERFPSHERGRAVGIYVGTFTLGAALSLFATGFSNSLLSWRWAFFVTSLGPMAGGAVAWLKLGQIPRAPAAQAQRITLGEVLGNRPVLLLIAGYMAHMWEMFGMRGWIVAFLTASLLTARLEFQRAVSLSAFIAGMVTLVGAFANALGGSLSDRFGRARTILVILTASSVLSLFFGWTRAFPVTVVVVLAILYGFLVPGESSVLSTSITELAPPAALGRTMALQSLLGFGAASLSPIVFGYVLDLTNPADALTRLGFVPNWGWSFTTLGIGGLLGSAAIWRLKRQKNGRRPGQFLVDTDGASLYIMGCGRKGLPEHQKGASASKARGTGTETHSFGRSV